jgi:hypothetical protein
MMVRSTENRPDTQHIKHQGDPHNPHPPKHTTPMPRLIRILSFGLIHGLQNT